jgi:hypothetical protein
MMNALQNATNKASFLKNLKQQDYAKFRSMATRQACSRLQCYDCWFQAAKNTPPATTQAPAPATTPAPAPAPAATPVPTQARRVHVSDQSQTPSISNQVKQALNEALGLEGMQILADIQSLNSTIRTEESTANKHSDSDNHNTPINNYSMSSSTNPNLLLQLNNLRNQLRHRFSTIRHQSSNNILKLPTINETNTTLTIQPQPKLLCQSLTPSSKVPPKKIKAVIDSGASDTMTAHKDLFESITYYPEDSNNLPHVMLGDEQTYHPVRGYGWINYFAQGHRIRQLALYVPALGNTTLISVKQHTQWQGTYFHAESDEATLAFPSNQLSVHTDDEMYIYITPAGTATDKLMFDEESAIPILTSSSTQQRKHTLNLISKHTKTFLPSIADHQQFKEQVQVLKLSPQATIPT